MASGKGKLRRLIALAIMFVMFIPVPDAVYAKQSELAISYTGTRDNPLVISSAQELFDFARLVNSGGLIGRIPARAAYVLLAEDIDLSVLGADWAPIGSEEIPFTGVFDGGSHTVSSLKIENPQASFLGLFGYIGEGGAVKNLTLGCDINGGSYIGGLVGSITGGTIDSCYTYGTVTGSAGTGGLSGRAVQTDILNSGSACGVNGSAGVGGLSGYATQSYVNSCHSEGEINGTNYVGGLIGSSNDTEIIYCYSESAVSGKMSVGGIAGRLSDNNIESCYTTGSVQGSERVGGVAGVVVDAGLVNCAYATGSVTGDLYVGGVAGICDDGWVQYSYSVGEVYGTQYVGGIVGIGNSDAYIGYNAALNPSIRGVKNKGRVVGLCYGTAEYNAAYSGMIYKNGKMEVEYSTHDGINGEDISIEQIIKNEYQLANGIILFTGEFEPGAARLKINTNYWFMEAGRLPVLRFITGGGGIPQYMKDAAGTADYAEFYGRGTAEEPYLIYTPEELARLAKLVKEACTYAVYSDKHYALMNDLDLSGYRDGGGWDPIGSESYPFWGVFDGGGRTIIGLFISRDEARQGLFGSIRSCEVYDVTLVGVNITGGKYTGGLAGEVTFESRVGGCRVSGLVNGMDENTGGITGYLFESLLLDCLSECEVFGAGDNIGGLVGFVSYYSGIYDCRAVGNVVSYKGKPNKDLDDVGGLIGYMHIKSRVVNCYATGDVIVVAAEAVNAGGLVGYTSDGYIENCYATGKVIGVGNVGGFAGSVSSGEIINCYAAGGVSGKSRTGGFIGFTSAVNMVMLVNCIALNPFILSDNIIYRITDMDGENVDVTNAAALDGCIFGGSYKTLNMDGVIVSAEEIKAEGFFEAFFGGSEAWLYEAGKLPVLREWLGEGDYGQALPEQLTALRIHH